MKKVIILLFLLLFLSCSNFSKRPNLYRAIYTDDILNSALNKHKFIRYKLVVVDTRWYNNESKSAILATRKVFKQFGQYLKKQAILIELIEKSSKKRDFFTKIQNQLNTNYNLDSDTPFIIFFKKSKFSKKYIPYNILSFHKISTSELENKLSVVGYAVSSGMTDEEIYSNLNDSRLNEHIQNDSVMYKLVTLISDWFI